MVQHGESKLSQERARELREKIQDENYLSLAIERIAEMMTRELFSDEVNKSGGLSGVSSVAQQR